MSERRTSIPPIALELESTVSDLGALVLAICCITDSADGLDVEHTRAVYSLSCMAITAWRVLDEAPEKAVRT